MFCWQARRGFAETLDKTAGLTNASLRRHLSGCADCSAELEKLRHLRSILSDAARIETAQTEDIAFEGRILRLARARAAAGMGNADPVARAWRPALPGALPVAAAFSLMVAAVVLSHLFSGGVPAGRTTSNPPAASETAAANDLNDRIVAPQEVPFVVHEDLVGARRGRIPLTTYVLEPAPDEQTGPGPAGGKTVMRASL